MDGKSTELPARKGLDWKEKKLDHKMEIIKFSTCFNQKPSIAIWITGYLRNQSKGMNVTCFCPVRTWKYVDGIQRVMPSKQLGQSGLERKSKNKCSVLKPSSVASTGKMGEGTVWILALNLSMLMLECSSLQKWIIPTLLVYFTRQFMPEKSFSDTQIVNHITITQISRLLFSEHSTSFILRMYD